MVWTKEFAQSVLQEARFLKLDVHRLAAARALGKDYDAVTLEERADAKSALYVWLYSS